MKGVIYVAKNKLNDKHYVGQTIRKWPIRKNEHINSPSETSAFDRAIKKYGIDNFIWWIEDEADDQITLDMLERLHISRFESMIDEWGYNIKSGGKSGNNGNTLHPTTIIKMKESSRGKNSSKYIGCYYKDKNRPPYNRVWQSVIRYNQIKTSLGYFNEPISGEIVFSLVFESIYNIHHPKYKATF